MKNIAEIEPGVVSVGNYYRDTDNRVHLISNYWGLNTLFQPPFPDRKLNVVFVSTASRCYAEKGIPARFLDAERAWLNEKQNEGRIKFEEFCLAGKKLDEVEEALAPADVIFMGGGNTIYLLQQLQDSQAGQTIRRRVQEGAWYFGKSAGAIVAGPNVAPRGFLAPSMATRPVEDTTGLGLTSVYPLPHVDTPSIMNQVYAGKTGWQYAIEMSSKYPTAYILDNLHRG